jgi:hypothetical protein
MKPRVDNHRTHPTNTIVTACDKEYFWGVLLLLGSIRMNHCELPIQIHTHGLGPRKAELLSHFKNVKVIPSQARSPHLNKPLALLHAQTEFVTWIDADCIFKGNLEPLLTPHKKGIHIRFREAEENRRVYGLKVNKTEEDGSTIPRSILETWQTDVGQRSQPLHETQCVTNFLSVHKDSKAFLAHWAKQIEKLRLESRQTVDNRNKAYFMTDESVLSSLLSFAKDSPPVYPYQLDQLDDQRLVHFGMSLKPWRTWRKKHLKHYAYVMSIIDYLQSNFPELPPIPKALNKQYKHQSYIASAFASAIECMKYQCKQLGTSLTA